MSLLSTFFATSVLAIPVAFNSSILIEENIGVVLETSYSATKKGKSTPDSRGHAILHILSRNAHAESEMLIRAYSEADVPSTLILSIVCEL